MGEFGEISEIGKALIVIGIVVLFLGLMLTFHDKIPLFGKLPGDIFIKKGNFSFYFPIMSMIIISVIISLIFMLFRK